MTITQTTPNPLLVEEAMKLLEGNPVLQAYSRLMLSISKGTEQGGKVNIHKTLAALSVLEEHPVVKAYTLLIEATR